MSMPAGVTRSNGIPAVHAALAEVPVHRDVLVVVAARAEPGSRAGSRPAGAGRRRRPPSPGHASGASRPARPDVPSPPARPRAPSTAGSCRRLLDDVAADALLVGELVQRGAGPWRGRRPRRRRRAPRRASARPSGSRPGSAGASPGALEVDELLVDALEPERVVGEDRRHGVARRRDVAEPEQHERGGLRRRAELESARRIVRQVPSLPTTALATSKPFSGSSASRL